MQAPALRFPFRAGEVVLGQGGKIESVIAWTDGPAYIVGGGLVAASIAGRPVSWPTPRLTVDVDEVELRFRSDSGLGLTLRHTFAAGWGVRLALGNGTGDPVELDAQLGWVPGTDCAAFALPAGATGGYAVLADRSGEPLLGGELTLGSLVWADAEWLGLGRIELPPFGRYVVQWQWDWYPSPQRYERGRFPSVPRQLVLRTGEVARIAASDDEAVVVRGADPVRVGGELELSMTTPHRVPVRVSSARGVTAYDLTWVAPVAEVLTGLGTSLTSGPLADVDAALALQHVLVGGETHDPSRVEDALDRFTGRLLDAAPTLAPREIGFLGAESGRTGDVETLAGATAALLDMRTPAPGVGLAATHVCVARMVAGLPMAEVLGHLAGLAAEASGTGLDDLAVRLELLAVGPGRGTSAELSVWAEVDALLDQLGLRLGAGLRGRPVNPLPVDDLAYLSVVIGLLPEEVGAANRRAWGMSPHALARRTEAEVIARLAGQPPRAAYGWLALGYRLR